MKRYTSEFATRLSGFTLDTLEADVQSVFAVSQDLRLSYVNPAYCEFAERNDTNAAALRQYPIGANLLDAVVGPIKEAFAQRLQSVLTNGRELQHEYVCNSPTLHREFHQRILPLKDGHGLVFFNSLHVEAPMTEEAHPPVVASYIQATGLLTQCSNCRRTQRSDDPRRWDWVPLWVAATPANTSHSICPPCFEYYW